MHDVTEGPHLLGSEGLDTLIVTEDEVGGCEMLTLLTFVLVTRPGSQRAYIRLLEYLVLRESSEDELRVTEMLLLG